MNGAADYSSGGFDHYARLVRRLLNVPLGLVSIVEVDRQVFPGIAGLPEPYRSMRETPLSHSFCQYVVKDEQPLVINDARTDPRLADNLAIEELDIVAYAGWPLTDHAGRTIGSLCAIDSTPREWTPEEIETLKDLASACVAELNERERVLETAAALAESERLGERSRVLLSLSTRLSFTETLADVASAVVAVSMDELGCEHAEMWLRSTRVSLALDPIPVNGTALDAEVLGLVDHEAPDGRSGRVAASVPIDDSNPLGAALVGGGPLFLDNRGGHDHHFPALAHAHQVGQARAYVPLTTGGHVYGAMALVWPTERDFSDEDRITIAALASYAAQAVQRAQLVQERIDVSLTLQTAMLTRLPQPDHLHLAARYLPAGAREQVGGDWYDAVVMPSGSTHLVIGDVEGHDIGAAAVMGQLRSMMRMAAWMSESPPARDLERLDRAMHDLDVDTLASAVLARIEQTAAEAALGLRRLRWSNAGHLPPVVVEPDGTARMLETTTTDPLLGLVPGVERHDHEVVLHAESTVLFYTDGLVERRRESIEVGLDRLLHAASAAAHLDVEEFLDSVLDRVASKSLHDDVAVLVVRLGREQA